MVDADCRKYTFYCSSHFCFLKMLFLRNGLSKKYTKYGILCHIPTPETDKFRLNNPEFGYSGLRLIQIPGLPYLKLNQSRCRNDATPRQFLHDISIPLVLPRGKKHSSLLIFLWLKHEKRTSICLFRNSGSDTTFCRDRIIWSK